MMVNIFYAGNRDEFSEYQIHIKNALDYVNIEYSLTIDPIDPLKIDYIVYAPNGEKDMAVLLNEKMLERLTNEADLVNIKEISGAGHWLPYTHKESVLNEIYSLNKDY